MAKCINLEWCYSTLTALKSDIEHDVQWKQSFNFLCIALMIIFFSLPQDRNLLLAICIVACDHQKPSQWTGDDLNWITTIKSRQLFRWRSNLRNDEAWKSSMGFFVNTAILSSIFFHWMSSCIVIVWRRKSAESSNFVPNGMYTALKSGNLFVWGQRNSIWSCWKLKIEYRIKMQVHKRQKLKKIW